MDPTIDTPAGQPDAGQAPATDTFDAERAKALIDKLRPFEKQAKKLEQELAELRQAEDTRKRAEMSELERLKADLAKAEEARTKAEQARQQTAIRSQIVAAAAKANLADPEDAYRFIDLATLTVDESGRAANLDEALQDLLKRKPYLAKQTSNAYSPTNPAGGAGKQSEREILNEIYGGRKANIWGGEGGGVYWNPTITE